MALRDDTADKLFECIKEAAGQTKDIEALHRLAEAFAFVAGTNLGTRNPSRSTRAGVG